MGLMPVVIGQECDFGEFKWQTREQGKSPEEILGFLAASCGWAEKGERVSLCDLLPRFDLGTIPHEPFMV